MTRKKWESVVLVASTMLAASLSMSVCWVVASKFQSSRTAAGPKRNAEPNIIDQNDGRAASQSRDNDRAIPLPKVSARKEEARLSRAVASRPIHNVTRESGEDWPRFRGPNGTGVSSQTGLPLEWSATKNTIWKTPLPGPGTSSPITFGDHVYVTCYSGYGLSQESPGDPDNLKRHLICVRRNDGEILWEKVVPSKVRESPFTSGVAHHGYASSTPAADQDGVYAFFGASGVAAYTHDGIRKWIQSCGTTVYGYGSAASPIVVDDFLIINAGAEAIQGAVEFRSKGALIALDKRTGRELWRQSDMFAFYPTPTLVEVNGTRQLVVGKRGGVWNGHALQSGREVWRCAVPVYAPTPVAHDGVLYIVSKDGYAAIRADGRGDVTATHKLWEVKRPAYRLASPIYWQGHVYWAPKNPAIACCANADTGEVVYRERFRPSAGEIYASPVLADSKIYYVSQRNGTYVLAAKPAFEILAHNKIESDESIFNGSPAVSRGQLLLRSDKFLYCIGNVPVQ